MLSIEASINFLNELSIMTQRGRNCNYRSTLAVKICIIRRETNCVLKSRKTVTALKIACSTII